MGLDTCAELTTDTGITCRGRGEYSALRHGDAWIRHRLRSGRNQRRHVTLTPDKRTNYIITIQQNSAFFISVFFILLSGK